MRLKKSVMEYIKESITINRAPEEVFSFLRQIEPRLRLNPSYKLLEFKRLTEGPIQKGSRYRVKAIAGNQMIEYESEVLELIENKQIATGDTGERLRVTLTLRPLQKGTILIHEEEFIIPDEALYISSDEKSEPPFWQKVLRFLIEIERTRIDERQRRKEEIIATLKRNLRTWLERIKEEIEGTSKI
jgi:hypothetical protein